MSDKPKRRHPTGKFVAPKSLAFDKQPKTLKFKRKPVKRRRLKVKRI